MNFQRIFSLFHSIEKISFNFYLWVFYIYAIFVLRGVLEPIFEHYSEFPHWVHPFIHWPLWYLNLFLSVIFIIYFFSRKDIVRISKVVFFLSFIMIFVPIIDHFVSQGKGFVIRYARTYDEIVSGFLSAAGLFGNSIATPGQAFAVWSIAIMLALYMLYLRVSLKRILVSIFTSYLVLSFYASFPIFIAQLLGFELPNFGHEVKAATIVFLLFLALIQTTIFFFIYSRKEIVSFLSSLKLSRAAHYLVLYIFGAFYPYLFLCPANIFVFSLFSFFFAGFLAFESCAVLNNIYDKELKGLKKGTAFKIVFSLSIFAIFFSLLPLNIDALIPFTAAFIIGILYSLPPVRLKRLGFANNLVIGLLSMLAFTTGFLTQLPLLEKLPLLSLLGVFITFSLAANVKDLKDYKTDKREKIKTLPVIFGYRKSIPIIALLLLISFAIFPAFFGNIHLSLIGAFFGLINVFALLRYRDEKVTFLIYFFAMALFGAYLFLSVNCTMPKLYWFR